MGARVIVARRQDADDLSWAFAWCPPHPALAGDVLGYMGYAEHAVAPVRRREVPTARVPVIISFGDTIRVSGLEDAAGAQSLTSFVAGFGTTHAITEYTGSQRGIQVDLTPLGAFRLLGLTGDEIRTGALDLTDVLGDQAHTLVDRLLSAPDWPARFGIVDAFLCGRAEAGRTADRPIDWAWQRMLGADGRLSVSRLATEAGWSRRHFVERFRRHVGVAPKEAARVLRFARAHRLLDGSRSISDVAADCGYADHGHLVREVRAMAGCTPSELIVERQHAPW